MDQLSNLKKITTVVSDTGEIDEIRKFQPIDATTNPSLILAASTKPQYSALIEDGLKWGRNQSTDKKEQINLAIDKICVNFGVEILKIVPGRVSTEVDASLSFDFEASLKKARQLIALYEAAGVDRSRVLIKLASTWECIQVARELEKEGIHCNMTLLFNLAQAVACADAGATLISPFVGRILDWYKKHDSLLKHEASEDPGVKSVTEIFHYYKKMGHKTQIMGASFRNVGEILELAGCDLLTIAPKFLDELKNTDGIVEQKLKSSDSSKMNIEKLNIDEKAFRWALCQDAMASEKLYEGIRNFNLDILKLKKYLETLSV